MSKCSTMEYNIECKECYEAEKKSCKDKKVDLDKNTLYEDCAHRVHAFVFRYVHKKGFTCSNCGWRKEADVQGADEEFLCRRFKVIISGRRVDFCVITHICERCFSVEYSRPVIKPCKHIRIYPPIGKLPNGPTTCANGTFDIPSAWKPVRNIANTHQQD